MITSTRHRTSFSKPTLSSRPTTCQHHRGRLRGWRCRRVPLVAAAAACVRAAVLFFFVVFSCSTPAATEKVASTPKCPHNTYIRADRKGRHNHCVCPSGMICEGCGTACTQESNVFKRRCVYGFKPDCDETECRCSSLDDLSSMVSASPASSSSSSSGGDNTGSSEISKYGEIIDRRKESFCPPEPAAAFEAHRYKGNRKFVFVVSNGHTGTTFFGKGSSWRDAFGDSQIMGGLYITHETEADKEAVKKIPWSRDYCQKARDYVVDQKIPHLEKILEGIEQRDRTGDNQPGTFFGSGHQIALGMIPALIDVLGDSAKFVRLRRNKMDVAYSYAQKNGGPCTHRCIFCLCPLDAAARMPIPGGLWEELSIYQRYLWFVDELEGQWQAVLRRSPEINYIEMDWDKKIEPEEFARLADFTGMAGVKHRPIEVKKANEHLNHKSKSAKNYTWMEEQVVEYAAKLGLKNGCTTYHCLDDINA